MPCASYRWIMALPINGFWTRDLPTDCRFAQDQTGVLAVFPLYYQRIDRGWAAVHLAVASAGPTPGTSWSRLLVSFDRCEALTARADYPNCDTVWVWRKALDRRWARCRRLFPR